jgi:hypothetical protein
MCGGSAPQQPAPTPPPIGTPGNPAAGPQSTPVAEGSAAAAARAAGGTQQAGTLGQSQQNITSKTLLGQ